MLNWVIVKFSDSTLRRGEPVHSHLVHARADKWVGLQHDKQYNIHV